MFPFRYGAMRYLVTSYLAMLPFLFAILPVGYFIYFVVGCYVGFCLYAVMFTCNDLALVPNLRPAAVAILQFPVPLRLVDMEQVHVYVDGCGLHGDDVFSSWGMVFGAFRCFTSIVWIQQ